MDCPFCKSDNTRVTQTRVYLLDLRPQIKTIQRRRECAGCRRRFLTYEVEDYELRKLRSRATPSKPANPQ